MLGVIRKRRTMHKRCLPIVLLASVLTNCATGPDVPSEAASDGRWRAEVGLYRMHGSYAASRLARQAAPYDEELARYTAYSDEWWAAKKAADDREVARLSRVLNICRGC